MWEAFRACSFSDQQLVENDAGVVRDLLNARYYNPNQGQFISQDPVFWEIGLTQDGKNALSNPQALNSYGYANDNPITGKDPNGRQCVACAGAEVLYSLGAQTAYDGVFGQSSKAVYGGDIVGASLYGFAYPWTLVAPVPVAVVAGGAGNAAQQGFEYLSGDRTTPAATNRARPMSSRRSAWTFGMAFAPFVSLWIDWPRGVTSDFRPLR
jgi:RHS repeat-associated protein